MSSPIIRQRRAGGFLFDNQISAHGDALITDARRQSARDNKDVHVMLALVAE